MKDLVAIVDAVVSARPASKKWWVSIVISPFDAEPTVFTTITTTHQLALSVDPFITRATLTVDGEPEYVSEADLPPRLVTLLERFERKRRVHYRLDRAVVSGAPPALKGAVRDWLRTVRPETPPSSSFEAVAKARGVDDRTVARWKRALEGGKGYRTELPRDVALSLLTAPRFVDVARAYLGGLDEVPELGSKRGFKRVIRVMALLVQEGDDRSLAVVTPFFERARKTRDRASYKVALMGALVDSESKKKAAWKRLDRLARSD